MVQDNLPTSQYTCILHVPKMHVWLIVDSKSRAVHISTTYRGRGRSMCRYSQLTVNVQAACKTWLVLNPDQSFLPCQHIQRQRCSTFKMSINDMRADGFLHWHVGSREMLHTSARHDSYHRLAPIHHRYNGVRTFSGVHARL